MTSEKIYLRATEVEADFPGCDVLDPNVIGAGEIADAEAIIEAGLVATGRRYETAWVKTHTQPNREARPVFVVKQGE